MPRILQLHAIGEIWHTVYIKRNKKINIPSILGKIIVFPTITQKKSIQAYLLKWLEQKAYYHFSNYLYILSKKTKLAYPNLSIRNQKTLWGSCNAKGYISLNSKLLFIPEDLYHYVLLHELCHTIYLNHSKCFWKFLNDFDNHYKAHDKALRRTEKFIPEWILNVKK